MMFTDKERKIFKYHDGTKDVYADPLAMNRKLRALMAGNPEKVVAAYNGDDDIAADAAAEVFFPAIAEAFQVTRFNRLTGEGFVDEDLLKLWEMFQAWLLEKKNRAANSPTSSTPSELRGLPRFPGR